VTVHPAPPISFPQTLQKYPTHHTDTNTAVNMVSHSDKDHPEAGNGLTIVDYEDLQRLDDDTLQLLSNAFVGTAAYGVVGIRGVPGYRESRKGAFEKAVNVAVHDSAARQQFAGVRQTYPGK